MVPDTPDVEQVLFAENGVAHGLRKGSIVVDMSSISPVATKDFARRINELGCDYLDAPVSGGEVGAKAATLTIMVGGPQAAFDKVKPLFELMGKNITLVGGNGDGQITKVANQIIVALNIAAVARRCCWPPGWRRCGQGAPGADGWVCQLPRPGSAWRAHDQAHVRTGLPHCAAPERLESGASTARQLGNPCPAPQCRKSCSIPARRMTVRHGITRHGARAGEGGQP